MGNSEEEFYEYGKSFERIVWVWEIMGKNCMSMGNVKEELFEYGKCCVKIVWLW